jgi:hypothetical protein
MVNDSMDFRSHAATYIGPSSDDYRNGEEYELMIQRFHKEDRYAVFKSSAHYNERPGYKVYPTKEAINQDFKFK